MRETRLTVVLSQGQSRNPEKRQLESDIASGAAAIDGVDVLVIPHLYDLANNGSTYQTLRALEGPLIVCTWLFDRAAHWVLDRNGVRGQSGEVLLKSDDSAEDDNDESDDAAEASQDSSDRVIGAQPRPSRPIFCIDLRVSDKASDYLAEFERIASVVQAREWLKHVREEAVQRAFDIPTNDTYVGNVGPGPSEINIVSLTTLLGTPGVHTIDEQPTRRWYPVIDFSRCTNCMECIDFCLFGVYGVDGVETILVEQPDNCRKGCPACSRVCPQNAIMFPQHKTPAIAGAPMDAGGLKIDLSKLFGAPDEGADAIEVAARERDEQLLLAGRQAVGLTDDLAARIDKASSAPKDDLDQLLDQLDSLEL